MTVEDTDTALHNPHDLLAEKGVLKAMLRSKDAIADIVEVLSGDDFYRPGHTLLYDTILDLYGRNHPTEPAAVIARLSEHEQLEEAGGAAYITALIEGPSPSRKWIADAERVENAALLRRTKAAAVHIEDLIIQAGAGFIVAVAGDIMRMPGLPKEPQAAYIDLVNGQVEGLQ